MKAFYRAGLLASILLECAVGFGDVRRAHADEVKIGVIIAQSGPLAQIGQSVVNGLVLADEQRDAGGKARFLFEDDGGQATRAVTAAEKLIGQDKVSALVTFAGSSSAAIAPIAEQRHIPLVTIAAGDKHTVGRPYVYRLFLSTQAQTDLLVDKIESGGSKRVAIVTTSQESLVRLRDLVRTRLADKIVFDEEVAPTDADMNGLATRAVAKRPEAIVLYLLPPQLAQFAKAAKGFEFKGKYFGGIQVLNRAQIEAAGDALFGTVFPAPRIEDSDNRFSEDYARRFGEPITSQQEIYGYDVATLLIAASGHPDIQSYLQSLPSISGLAGTYPRRENNFFEVPTVLKQIRTAQSVSLAE